MTKSTITREQLLEIIETDHVQCGEASQLARMALAAMDGEPVAEVVSIYGDTEAFGEREIRPLVGIQQMPYGTKLYRHAQPAPVVPDEMTIGDACKFVRDMRLFDDVSVIVMRTWNACRAAMLHAGNSPEQNQGWIPVSERMPEEGGRYWCYVEEQNSLGKSHYQWNCSWNGDVWSDKALTGRVTHWMPLPVAPQEVNGE